MSSLYHLICHYCWVHLTYFAVSLWNCRWVTWHLLKKKEKKRFVFLASKKEWIGFSEARRQRRNTTTISTITLTVYVVVLTAIRLPTRPNNEKLLKTKLLLKILFENIPLFMTFYTIFDKGNDFIADRFISLIMCATSRQKQTFEIQVKWEDFFARKTPIWAKLSFQNRKSL